MKTKTYRNIFSTFAVSLAMFGGAATAFAAAPTDYTNYWSFEDAAGGMVTDNVAGKNGTLVGTSPGFGWTSGKVGTALAMDGLAGESVSLPDNLITGTSGSLSLWFNMNELSNRNTIFSMSAKVENHSYMSFFVDLDGRPTIKYQTDPSVVEKTTQGNRILNRNEWYNLVITSDGLKYTLYVNGEQFDFLGSNTGKWFSPLSPSYTYQYAFGSGVSYVPGAFSGYIDDVRLFGRSLSFDEVQNIYNEGNIGVPLAPLAIRPALSFTVSQDQIASGGAVTLIWNANKVDGCLGNGDWTGTTATSGIKTFTGIVKNTSYTLSCSGKGGTVALTRTITVSTSTPAIGTTGTGTSTAPTITWIPVGGAPAPEPPAMTPSSFTKLNIDLRVGSRGDDVGALQAFLVRHAYLSAHLPRGYFGPATKAAVIKFQKAYNVNPTGFVGPLTRAKISVTN